MSQRWKIVNVKIRIVTEADGLVGYASCGLDLGSGLERGDLYLNNITVRRDHNGGELFLTYPKSDSRGGRLYNVWEPDGPELRVAIENEVLGVFASLPRGGNHA